MRKPSLTLTLTMALALLLVFSFNAFAQKKRLTIDAGSGSGAGLSSGLIGITAGQSTRLSVWNGGDKAVTVHLLIIDGSDKILITCDGFVSPGQSFSDKFTHPGGEDRIELRGEIRVDDQQRSDVLTPSLQVIDDVTAKTEVILGPCEFRSFKP